ncbi:MAG TPA: hypothetical protein VMS08_01750 [Candidatus Saccharimonadia bacterium]|nr:hypothetical protein [Candidatus Saccharimonadia bacterium]
MLMVCPNCHSDQVIAVQDQHFCINCGQAVPDPVVKTAVSKTGLVVQANGLPLGVKILGEPPLDAGTPTSLPDAPPVAKATSALVKARQRLQTINVATGKPKRKKPGRPKSGRLDVPKTIAAITAETLPTAPAITPPAESQDLAPAAVDSSITPRRMSDISPRKPHEIDHHVPGPAPKEPSHKPKASRHTKHKPKPPKIHKVGLPPLHYGHVLATSLRARVMPRHLGLAAFAATSLAAISAYATWLLLSGGLTGLASTLLRSGLQACLELVVLAAIYYVGRSIGQSAITTSVVREADHRPISLSRAVGTAVNTFASRLVLDVTFGLLNLLMLALVVALVIFGGSDWPVNIELQLVALFCAFLVLLYLMMALTLSRGLAGVATTLTNKRPFEALGLGWRLFSHRFELMGLRFLALALELLLAIPLALLAVALVYSAPKFYHPLVIIGVGVLAWLAGALLGAGSAAWWATLYRNLVMADHPDGLLPLLASRTPQPARTSAVALVASLSTFLLAAALALPWLRI